MSIFDTLRQIAQGCAGWRARGLLWLVVCPLALPVQAAEPMSVMEMAAQSAYSRALQQIEQEQYPAALAGLRQLQRRFPGFEQMAAVQTRIAVLQESADAGQSLPVFLRALTLRESGDIVAALQALNVIASADPAGTLTDDALYVTAYLQIMDRYDFQAARIALQTLEARFPESAYSDSAHYLDAIALEQLGETQLARDRLLELRARHTALDLPLDFRWPRGSVLSRYWFDRADRRLAIVEQRLASASRVDVRQEQDDGKLRIAVSVEGMDLQLLLLPSPLTRETQWLDSHLTSDLPPSIGVFDGTVEGVEGSWVRVVLEQDSISGVVNMGGRQYRLQPGNLIGTLDYYQPRSRKREPEPGLHSDLAESLQGLDALHAPPAQGLANLGSRSRSIQTDMRAVPVSIVVDSQYDRYYGGRGMSNALNNLNVADGVYRELGLALSLDEAMTLTAEADPLDLGAVTLESILRSFRDYRLQYKTLFEDSALTYLFTGNPKTDVTLGLAWIGTACRLDGYDVGVTTPSTFGDVLLSHELGHSLGALHDTDTACDDNARSLMWPNISERTDAEFSSCSRSDVLQSRTRNCLLNSVDLQLAASSAGSSLLFEIRNPDTGLTLDAQLIIETSAPDQLLWPAGCQVQTPTSAMCHISGLLPQESRSLSLAVSDDFHGSDAPVTGQLLPLGVLELQDADNTATVSPAGGVSQAHLNVSNPAVDLASVPEGAEVSANNPGQGAANAGGGSLTVWLLLCLFGWRVQRGLMTALGSSGRMPSSSVSSRVSNSVV
ncbi:M12 family metallo-peptidase [Granulosicoccus sp. 3-233]|uniref:M12 family metallo-peptidase n=1 Tax=Granulosicoccus sp. 3-233 TaxID=3417969 RepID=UPI003D34F3D1